MQSIPDGSLVILPLPLPPTATASVAQLAELHGSNGGAGAGGAIDLTTFVRAGMRTVRLHPFRFPALSSAAIWSVAMPFLSVLGRTRVRTRRPSLTLGEALERELLAFARERERDGEVLVGGELDLDDADAQAALAGTRSEHGSVDGRVRRRGVGSARSAASNVEDRVRGDPCVTVSMQVAPCPLQAPVQVLNTAPASGFAVNETLAPSRTGLADRAAVDPVRPRDVAATGTRLRHADLPRRQVEREGVDLHRMGVLDHDPRFDRDADGVDGSRTDPRVRGRRRREVDLEEVRAAAHGPRERVRADAALHAALDGAVESGRSRSSPARCRVRRSASRAS